MPDTTLACGVGCPGIHPLFTRSPLRPERCVAASRGTAPASCLPGAIDVPARFGWRASEAATGTRPRGRRRHGPDPERCAPQPGGGRQAPPFGRSGGHGRTEAGETANRREAARLGAGILPDAAANPRRPFSPGQPCRSPAISTPLVRQCSCSAATEAKRKPSPSSPGDSRTKSNSPPGWSSARAYWLGSSSRYSTLKGWASAATYILRIHLL